MSASGNSQRDIHKKLLDKCRMGNRKAQAQIYKLYYKAMYNVSLRIIGQKDEAEDIMQESFLRAFEKLDQFTGEVSFGAWLKKIVVNRSLDHLRKRKIIFEDIDEQVNSFVDEETETCREDLSIEDIKKEIEKLPDGYRVVLSLYLIEGYDHEEISEITGISPSTSRSQYARARKKLAENLKKKINERS